MSYYSFACNDLTQITCFDKSLFGDNRQWPLKVKKGDTCLLYNYDSKFLYGVWKADSDGKKNIDLTAWDGTYPFQVRVKLSSKNVVRIPCYNLRKLFPSSAVYAKSQLSINRQI